jgi:hypothetical protein
MPFFGALLLAEDGTLEVWTDGDIEHFSVRMEFEYHVAGETYPGKYVKSLIGYGRQDAEKLLESFRQGPLYVRYLPSKPEVYVCDPFRDVRP